jgi:hypothetical protein
MEKLARQPERIRRQAGNSFSSLTPDALWLASQFFHKKTGTFPLPFLIHVIQGHTKTWQQPR